MFREKINSTDFNHMPREYQELLIRVLTIQADCEIGGPHVYGARWLLDAPRPMICTASGGLSTKSSIPRAKSPGW